VSLRWPAPSVNKALGVGWRRAYYRVVNRMTNQPDLILFATNQPLLVASFRDVLRLAGFDAEHVVLGRRDAFAALRSEDAWLIFLDTRHAPAATVAQAVRRSPQSRFVLCGTSITPLMLQTAVDGCMHGVLSTSLPVEEAATALTRIWQGERQFRFDRPSACQTEPPYAGADFDAEWMFGYAAR
jgi:DNA-binding NarL/FixJ family response regulator